MSNQPQHRALGKQGRVWSSSAQTTDLSSLIPWLGRTQGRSQTPLTLHSAME